MTPPRLAGSDGEEDAADERQKSGLDPGWYGVDDAPPHDAAADESQLYETDGGDGVATGGRVQRSHGGRLGRGVDREDGRTQEAEGRVGGVDGGEDGAFEATMQRHGTEGGVGAGATVRDRVAASEADGAHARTHAERRADRRPVEREGDREAAECEQQDGHGAARTGQSVDGREDEAAAEEAGGDRDGDDSGEGEADRRPGRAVGGRRCRQERRPEENDERPAAPMLGGRATDRTIVDHGTGDPRRQTASGPVLPVRT